MRQQLRMCDAGLPTVMPAPLCILEQRVAYFAGLLVSGASGGAIEIDIIGFVGVEEGPVGSLALFRAPPQGATSTLSTVVNRWRLPHMYVRLTELSCRVRVSRTRGFFSLVIHAWHSGHRI